MAVPAPTYHLASAPAAEAAKPAQQMANRVADNARMEDPLGKGSPIKRSLKRRFNRARRTRTSFAEWKPVGLGTVIFWPFSPE